MQLEHLVYFGCLQPCVQLPRKLQVCLIYCLLENISHGRSKIIGELLGTATLLVREGVGCTL